VTPAWLTVGFGVRPKGRILDSSDVNVDGADVRPSGAESEAFAEFEASLLEIERTRPEGLTSGEILELLRASGMHVSEATLRKYVQIGLLPRSVRVGQKGKHLGSRGLYPTEVVRRIALIKALMAERYTIEDIKRRLLFLSVDIDKLESSIRAMLTKIREGAEIGGAGAGSVALLSERKGGRAELRAIERLGRELIQRLRKLDRESSRADADRDRDLETDGGLRRVV